jgi:hypothetical protein
MLLSEKSQVRFAMRLRDFSINPILSAVLWPPGSTKPIREMITVIFLG